MRKLTCLFALGFLLFNNTLRANEPEKVTSTEEVSETAAKKVLNKNPNVLIMVEGIEIYPKNIKMTTTKSSVSVDTEKW